MCNYCDGSGCEKCMGPAASEPGRASNEEAPPAESPKPHRFGQLEVPPETRIKGFDIWPPESPS